MQTVCICTSVCYDHRGYSRRPLPLTLISPKFFQSFRPPRQSIPNVPEDRKVQQEDNSSKHLHHTTTRNHVRLESRNAPTLPNVQKSVEHVEPGLGLAVCLPRILRCVPSSRRPRWFHLHQLHTSFTRRVSCRYSLHILPQRVRTEANHHRDTVIW